jgi:hypothetical protein
MTYLTIVLIWGCNRVGRETGVVKSWPLFVVSGLGPVGLLAAALVRLRGAKARAAAVDAAIDAARAGGGSGAPPPPPPGAPALPTTVLSESECPPWTAGWREVVEVGGGGGCGAEV